MMKTGQDTTIIQSSVREPPVRQWSQHKHTYETQKKAVKTHTHTHTKEQSIKHFLCRVVIFEPMPNELTQST
jgi:hypothetical protein